jgi:hypothetical protein
MACGSRLAARYICRCPDSARLAPAAPEGGRQSDDEVIVTLRMRAGITPIGRPKRSWPIWRGTLPNLSVAGSLFRTARAEHLYTSSGR